jgi:hypothetical protein
MRFPSNLLVALAICCAASTARAGENAPPANFEQNGKLNIALSMAVTDMQSMVTSDQRGEKNLFLSYQALATEGSYQFHFKDGVLPLNSVRAFQYGERNVSVARQDGINNGAIVIQNGEPGGSSETQFHQNSLTDEPLPQGGFTFSFESGDVEIAAQYNVDGYRISSSFGRSH